MKTPGLTYLLISIPKFWQIPVSLGLCVPDVCRIEDLEDFKPSIVKSINAAEPVVFRGIKGLNDKKTLRPKHVLFKQPSEENHLAYSFDFGTGLVIFSFSILLCLLIGGTSY